MSGFGIRAFKKLKKENSANVKKTFVPYLVIGDSFWAVIAARKLESIFGSEKVKVLNETKIDFKKVLLGYDDHVSTLRDEGQVKLLRDLSSKFEILKNEDGPRFYKDARLHLFSSRTKPYTLLNNETFFTQNSYEHKTNFLWNDEDEQNIHQSLEELEKLISTIEINKYILSIEKVSKLDLVDNFNYVLKTGDSEEIHAQKVIYCKSPMSFYKLFSNKEELNSELAQYCSSLESISALVVNFESKNKLSATYKTFLLPQSQTHEWGHFIVDLLPFTAERNIQEIKTLTFIDENEEVTEDLLTKKIKLLKRTLERVFPDFQSNNSDTLETISYEKDFLIKSIDEFSSSYTQDFARDNVFFQGIGAPVKDASTTWNSLLYNARAICSYYELAEEL